MMLSGGAGFSFFNNVVRTGLLFGYTPDGVYKDISITAKLNARVVGIELSSRTGLFQTVGAAFTFFSGNSKVVSSAVLSQELDIKNLWIFSTFTFFVEEYLYFVENKEGSVLFQLALGIRLTLF